MPRQEELELALRDSITPGLKAIAAELKALNQAAKESAQQTSQEVDRIGHSTEKFSAITKTVTKDVGEMFKTVVEYGKTILGVGGAYEAVNKLSESLKELATTRVQLSMFAQDTRISAQEIERMHGAMTRMGIDAKQADGYIGGLSTKLQELRSLREGSTLFQELEKMGAGGVNLARKLLDEKDVSKQIKLITEVFKTQTPEVQFHLSQMLGVPQSVLANLDTYESKVKDVLQVAPEVAQKYLDNLSDLKEKADAEWTTFGAHALEVINKWFDRLNSLGGDQEGHSISKYLIEGFDDLDKTLQQDLTDIKAFLGLLDQIKAFGDWVIDKWRPDLAAKREEQGLEPSKRLEESLKKIGEGKTPGGVSAEEAFRTKAIERLQLQQENTKLLTDIRDTLNRAGGGGDTGGGVGIRGGGVGGGGRPASEGDVTGGMQASGGGFRPRGGVKGAKAGTGEKAAVDATQYGTLAEQRAPYLKYLNEHPDLKAKFAALLVSEEPSREGRVGTAETFFNRMISHGVSPEQMGTSIGGLASGPGVYYEPLRPGGTYGRSAAQIASDPTLKSQTLEDIDKAGAGSNVSRLGTQNASAGVAAHGQETQTVTREAIRGISDQWSRKDVHPEEHGPGIVAREKRWYEQTQQAMKARQTMDQASRESKSSVFTKGTAAVSVDFGDTKDRTKESKEGGEVFKPLNNAREPQSPKAGDSASFNDRWHFQ